MSHKCNICFYIISKIYGIIEKTEVAKMKYIKLFLINYLLLFFCLTLILPLLLFINSFLRVIIVIIILFGYSYITKKKGYLNLENFQFNLFLTIIITITFTICMVISQGFMSHPIWYLYNLFTIPFFLFTFIMLFIGQYFLGAVIIILILWFHVLFDYLFLKIKMSLKKITVVTISLAILCSVNYFTYTNSPAHKYHGGHQFEYMQGYSTTDLSPFTPYAKNSQLVTLPEECNFTIQEEKDMPILDGAEACYPVYSAIAKAVYKDIDKLEENYIKNKDYTYTNGKIVSFTNTSLGYSRLINGEVDMFFGAKPSASQIEEAKNAGVEFEYAPIGREAFVFFVNQENPIEQLTTQQIKDIYHGTITNWKQLGGENNDIIAFQRPERSGSQAMMNAFMGEISLKEPLSYEMVSGMGEIITDVAEYQNEVGAIGYTFQYFLEGLNQEENVKILSIDNIYPSNDTIKDQSYPLSTYLYCVTLKSNTKENTKKLREFLLSEQGQYIIEKTGYYALN